MYLNIKDFGLNKWYRNIDSLSINNSYPISVNFFDLFILSFHGQYSNDRNIWVSSRSVVAKAGKPLKKIFQIFLLFFVHFGHGLLRLLWLWQGHQVVNLVNVHEFRRFSREVFRKCFLAVKKRNIFRDFWIVALEFANVGLVDFGITHGLSMARWRHSMIHGHHTSPQPKTLGHSTATTPPPTQRPAHVTKPLPTLFFWMKIANPKSQNLKLRSVA